MRRSVLKVKLTAMLLFAGGWLLLCLAAAPGTAGRAARLTDQAKKQHYRPRLPLGIPPALWEQSIPAANPMTAEKVALGEALYFDKRLSADGTVSCATCHDPAAAFASHDACAVGVKGATGTRNAPTVLNATFSSLQFWDGRAASLEEQVKLPLLNSAEMGMPSHAAVVARVAAVAAYRQQFRQVFAAEGITIDTIAKAVAAYERTRLSGDAPFDRFQAGDRHALTEAQRRGWELFQHKARCITCHTFNDAAPFFTDFKFHNTGIAAQGQPFALLRDTLQGGAAGPGGATALNGLAHAAVVSELGRYLVTRRPEDVGAFKTPTLRDVELTMPYMHDGSVKTLLDVVRFYNQGGERNPHLDERMRPLGLTVAEMNDLVEFMRALTSHDVLRQSQSARPQTRTAIAFPPTP